MVLTTQIIFPTTAIAPAGGELGPTPVTIHLADDNDHRMYFGDNVAKRVQVDENGGGAAGAAVSADGITFGASAVVEFEKGVATVYTIATGTGTVVCSLVDVDSTGLTLGGDATVTYS